LRVLFMGTPAFAVPTLAAVSSAFEVVAVVTQPDKRRGRGRKASFSAVKEWALAAGLPVEQPTTLRDAEAQAQLRSYAADVIVVVAYGLILPPGILGMPPLGCVNVHGSLLPRHRGAAPIAWAILGGDEETGVTTMMMDEGLDTGPMLLHRSIPLQPEDTTESLTPRLAALGAALLVETLEGLARGVLTAQPQPAEGVTLAPSFKKQDGAIDWTVSAAAVARRVRALQPWPGSFTFWKDERLTLWQVRRCAAESPAPPGTVVAVGDDGIRVACGEDAVQVIELQRSGGRRQPAAEFLRGRPIEVGERFAPQQG
jgi:methionyl-tRNA formyltransferase